MPCKLFQMKQLVLSRYRCTHSLLKLVPISQQIVKNLCIPTSSQIGAAFFFRPACTILSALDGSWTCSLRLRLYTNFVVDCTISSKRDISNSINVSIWTYFWNATNIRLLLPCPSAIRMILRFLICDRFILNLA